MLAIAGGKGGVGKTTVALGLARALARSGRDPVVVDADVDMPNLHVLADVDREPTADRLAAGGPIEEALQYGSVLPRVGVIAAGRPETVPAALERLDRWHGPVLVDCPGGAGGDAARPLRACDRTVLVTTATPAARADTRKTAAVARRLEAAPLVVLVREGTAPQDCDGTPRDGDGTQLFQCPVERLPTVEADRVHAHPRFQAVCETVRRMLEGRLRADISTRDGGRIFKR